MCVINTYTWKTWKLNTRRTERASTKVSIKDIFAGNISPHVWRVRYNLVNRFNFVRIYFSTKKCNHAWQQGCMIPLNRDRTGAINIGTNFKRLMTGQQLIRPMTNQDLLYHQADACMVCSWTIVHAKQCVHNSAKTVSVLSKQSHNVYIWMVEWRNWQ